MKTIRFIRLQRSLLLVVTFSIISFFFTSNSVITVSAQTTDKTEKVIKKYSFKNEPIEFLQLQSDGKTVKADEKFVEEGDWLKDFTIRFKNISGKPITYVEIVLLFPETGPNGSPISHPLKYGVHRLAKPNTRDKAQLLAANDMAEVKLSDDSFKNLKISLLSRSILSDLTEVDFRIMTVHFSDGTHWTAGTNWIPNPDKEGKFIAAEDITHEKDK